MAVAIEGMWTCLCGDDGIIQLDISDLVEHSGYFSAMLNSQMRETQDREFHLPLFSTDTICFLLNVFSCRNKQQTQQEILEVFAGNMHFDTIEDLLRAIDYLFMPCLYPKCCEMLNILIPSFCVSVARVWRMWEACQEFGLQATQEELCIYISKNMLKMIDIDYFFFREMPLKLLTGVLCISEIEISSELDIVKYIDEWISYCRGREKHIDELFKCIHIPSLIHSDLTRVEEMLTRYDATEKGIWKVFSQYVKNPLHFFVSRPDLSPIRNEQTIVMLFGGIPEQNMLPQNVELNSRGRRRRGDVSFHHLSYQEIDEICARCLNCGERQQIVVEAEKQRRVAEAEKKRKMSDEISPEENCDKPPAKKWQKSIDGKKRKYTKKKAQKCEDKQKTDVLPDKSVSPSKRKNKTSDGGKQLNEKTDINLGPLPGPSCSRHCSNSTPSPPKRLSSANSSDPSQSNGLKLKQINRLRTAIKLVEFGVCSYKNFVFVAGGQRMFQDESKCSVRGVHRLDPHIGEWSEIGMMQDARCLFYMAEVWNRLFAVGGANQYGPMRHVEYYIPEEDQWYSGPDLPNPLHEHAGCVFDNKLYISGGHDDTAHMDKVWVLETTDGPWKPSAPMLQPRSYHAMATVGDHIYVVGGCRKVDDSIKDILTMEQYDVKTDLWTKILIFNIPISCSSPVVIDDEIMFIGTYCFNQKVFLQQTVSIDTKRLSVRIAPLEFAADKRIIGYQAFKMQTKKKILK